MIIKHLELIRPINCGRYGTVYKAFDKRANSFRAVKMLPKKRHDVPEKENLQIIDREISHMARLTNHINIVHLYDVLQDDENFYLVEELCGGSTLHETLMTGKCSSRAKVNALCDVANALVACHNAHILFCDLKPKNVIYAPETAVYKLTDFGSSIDKNAKVPQRILTATRDYAAPELIENMHASFPYDIWSLGVMAYWMFYYVMPPTEGKIIFPPLASTEPHYMRDFIANALQKNPANRPSAKEVLEYLHSNI